MRKTKLPTPKQLLKMEKRLLGICERGWFCVGDKKAMGELLLMLQRVRDWQEECADNGQ